jgi:hypothetical protein
MTVTSMSKQEVIAKYAWLDQIHSDIANSKSAGTWSERNSRQKIANEKAKSQGYYVAWREQIAIENNPVNIARWKKEEEIELKRLADIKLKEEKEIRENMILKELKLRDEKIKKQEEKILDLKKEEEKRLSDLLIQSDELESFYEFDPITENKEIIESITVPVIENKEIPLASTTPILLILGIGLVSYYLLKGNKK